MCESVNFRLEHELRKFFGHSADPASVAGDAISLRESLDTISKHLEACHDLARNDQQFSMESIEPSMENLHFLKYKMG